MARSAPDSLLEIAEIGLATADTDGTRAALLDALGAPILWGGRRGSLLTAIGDDRGVVIVAPTGRDWVPIGLPARPLPTTQMKALPQSPRTAHLRTSDARRGGEIECDLCHRLSEPFVAHLASGPAGWTKPPRTTATGCWAVSPED